MGGDGVEAAELEHQILGRWGARRMFGSWGDPLEVWRYHHSYARKDPRLRMSRRSNCFRVICTAGTVCKKSHKICSMIYVAAFICILHSRGALCWGRLADIVAAGRSPCNIRKLYPYHVITV
jgi:hypothetical protein